MFEAEGANSVAWNADCEGMLCYSGGGSITIKTGDFPPHSQKMAGFVVGFKVRPKLERRDGCGLRVVRRAEPTCLTVRCRQPRHVRLPVGCFHPRTGLQSVLPAVSQHADH